MDQSEDFLKLISTHAKSYGYIYPSSEIYEGLGALYDYGPLGVGLKNNLKEYWWRWMTQLRGDVVGLDSAILMHPEIWKASGHVEAFSDPLIDNKVSKRRYRADVLVQEYVEGIEKKIEQEVSKGRKSYGAGFNQEEFLRTDGRVGRYVEKKEDILRRLGEYLNRKEYGLLKGLIEELGICDVQSGTKEWTEVRDFNLMFETRLGATESSERKVYLRPETAQGIFVNFLNVQRSSRMKVPFGIAQIGKAFRNEIVARQFIFRMREFEQMEMQFFIPPVQQQEWYEYWKAARLRWHLAMGLGDGRYRFRDHEKLSHYAKAASDIEFKFPFGFKELEGIHSRGDFDLSSHERYSGKKLQYYDLEQGRSYVPYVVESSVGLDRLFLAVLSSCYVQEELESGGTRVVLRIPGALSGIKAAVLPLVRKQELVEISKRLVEDLRWDFAIEYDEKDSIGKRYRREDAKGTPFCITIDYESLEDESVTIRDRDSMHQQRIPIRGVFDFIKKHTSLSDLLKKAKV